MKTHTQPPGRSQDPDAVGRCFHCGDPLPATQSYLTLINDSPRNMCCAGCQAVAQTIVDAGLEDYYTLRSHPADRSRQRVPDFLRAAQVYAEPVVADDYVLGDNNPGGARQCTLLLQDLECSACCWLIEQRLGALAGIGRVNLNYSNQRARIDFDPEHINLAEILAAIDRLGYRALPYDPGRSEIALQAEDRQRLKRLGIAGLFGMQIMTLALALYTGGWWGMAPHIEQLLRWASLVLSLPIIGYSALPFFSNALRSVRNRSPGMDLPVSLGLLIAFSASVAATVQGRAEVYFDSLAMFVFFLLLARYLEFLARKRGRQQREQRLQAAPDLAHRIIAGGLETVPVARLELGDHLRVLGGDPVPADGRIVAGNSNLDESLLSGESRPVARRPGDTVIAGSVNLDQPLEVVVTALGRDRVIARILELVDRAADEKPALAQLADRVAGIFVILILLLAAAVAGFWLLQDPERWLRATIAVLVVTCPCALSLATPTALTAASGALVRHGIIPGQGLRLEQLAGVSHVMFDKTGTLTRGEFSLTQARTLADEPLAKGLAIAAAMENHCLHPIAKALLLAAGEPSLQATHVTLHAGEGLQAEVDGRHWWLGSVAWIKRRHPGATDWAERLRPAQSNDTLVVLADDLAPQFLFALGDEVRADAGSLVQTLNQAGIRTSVCSGDNRQTVLALARQVGIRDVHAEWLPGDKLAVLEALRRSGEHVAMIGDGVNDAPVLAGADVSFALGSGALAARVNADFILLGESLHGIAAAMAIARKTRRIIAQNLSWAVLYNLLAIPAAAAGWLAPWMAAIGMSLSSLLVVANSLRCGWTRKKN